MFRTAMGMQAWLEQLHNKVIDYNYNYFDIVIVSAILITGFIKNTVITFLFNLDYIHDYIMWGVDFLVANGGKRFIVD